MIPYFHSVSFLASSACELDCYLVSGEINPSVTDQYLIPLWATKTCMIIFTDVCFMAQSMLCFG